MWSIEAIGHRTIFNSHAEPTTEYSIYLSDGSVGRGASPQGETISIYEDKGRLVDVSGMIAELCRGDALRDPFDQGSFDRLLGERVAPVFGKNTCYALSLAFSNACREASGSIVADESAGTPRLCCNILNGGWHAYTNPVLSNFPEYLLVATSDDIDEVIGSHAQVQRVVREVLAGKDKVTVGGNPVSRFATPDDRECVEFLLGVCSDLGLSDDFELMIDASAGDLWRDDRYHLELTDGTARTSEEMAGFWLDLLEQYPLRFLEDPFRETDADAWGQPGLHPTHMLHHRRQLLLLGRRPHPGRREPPPLAWCGRQAESGRHGERDDQGDPDGSRSGSAGHHLASVHQYGVVRCCPS